jgi:hypothetical protein
MMNDEFGFDDVQDAFGVGMSGGVAQLLRAAAADLEPLDVDPDPAFLADMIAVVVLDGAAGVPADELGQRRRQRVVRIALVAGALGLTATGAAAANGSLPDPVQDVVSDVAESVGITLPAGSQDGPGHGRSDEAPGRPAVPGQPTDPGRSDEAPGRPADPGAPGVGPEETPPGQGGTVPGTGEDTGGVGPDETPPGQGGTVPGTDEPPGPPEDPGGGNRGITPGGAAPSGTARGGD